jgi:hypothetical protein
MGTHPWGWMLPTVSIGTVYDPAELFQWAPTLGGGCYDDYEAKVIRIAKLFQWAPTLGGGCYLQFAVGLVMDDILFQWAPTLGGGCYQATWSWIPNKTTIVSMGTHPWGWMLQSLYDETRYLNDCGFNGHPPLGVDATCGSHACCNQVTRFQWAPTLGGGCYLERYGTSGASGHSFNGHPPLGVDATS